MSHKNDCQVYIYMYTYIYISYPLQGFHGMIPISTDSTIGHKQFMQMKKRVKSMFLVIPQQVKDQIFVRMMEEILHQLIWRIHHYFQGFIHPRWCRISSINSSLYLEDPGFFDVFSTVDCCLSQGFDSARMLPEVRLPHGQFVLDIAADI